MPTYSTAAADLLAANIMRSLETKQQESSETSTGKLQSESGQAAFPSIAAQIPSTPVVQSQEIGIQRQCSECAKEQSTEEGKDIDEISLAASGIQTKLTIGAPPNPYQQAANQMAEVMSKPILYAPMPQVQRFSPQESQIQLRAASAQSISPMMQMSVEQQAQMSALIQRTFRGEGTQASFEPVQAKLTVGEAGDKYEQEADAVARQVVEKINAPTTEPSVQRQSEVGGASELNITVMRQSESGVGGGASVTQDVEQGIQQARGGGKGLDESVREPMEQAFGADFSGVRVHTDANSDVLNRSISARAFTTGQDIFFKQGEYDPGSRGGQELLAHELTHVVQQTGGGGIQAKLDVPIDDNSDQKASVSSFKQSLTQTTVQRVPITLPEITIVGDPHFYQRAQQRNEYYSAHPPLPGWPYEDRLRSLWLARAYDDFADTVREYQTTVMGQTGDQADGILGSKTAASIQTRPMLAEQNPAPAETNASDGSSVQQTDGVHRQQPGVTNSLTELVRQWRNAGLLDPPFRPSDVPAIPAMPMTEEQSGGVGLAPAAAGLAAPVLQPQPPNSPAPWTPRVIPGGGGTPAPRPSPVPRGIGLGRWLGPIGVFIGITLTSTPTAPPWMDELNPITGGSYSSPQEYEWVRRLTGPQLDYLRHLNTARRLRPDPALENDPDPSTLPTPLPQPSPNPRDRQPPSCFSTNVARRGGHARHDAYATKVTGSPLDYFVMSPTIGQSITYDGLQPARNVWEVKVGYGWFFNPDYRSLTDRTLARFDSQKNRGLAMAVTCRYVHLWSIPDRRVASLLTFRWSGNPPVLSIPE